MRVDIGERGLTQHQPKVLLMQRTSIVLSDHFDFCTKKELANLLSG